MITHLTNTGNQSIDGDLTVVGSISATEYLNLPSGSWELASTKVRESSAFWDSTSNALTALSGDWQKTYNTVSTLSGNWAYKNVDNNFSATQTFATSAINIGTFPFHSLLYRQQKKLFFHFKK